MRRMINLGLALLVLVAGCARPQSGPYDPGRGDAAPTARAGIYTAVVRRYLTSGDNSFSGRRFPVAFVLDRADPAAADPMGEPTTGVPITDAEQAAIIAALADVGPVEFVPGRDEVVDGGEDCPTVRDGGVLIVLAPPSGGGDRVEVGIHGYVACLGATWFTYVVERDGAGWTVTGKTGPEAIA